MKNARRSPRWLEAEFRSGRWRSGRTRSTERITYKYRPRDEAADDPRCAPHIVVPAGRGARLPEICPADHVRGVPKAPLAGPELGEHTGEVLTHSGSARGDRHLPRRGSIPAPPHWRSPDERRDRCDRAGARRAPTTGVLTITINALTRRTRSTTTSRWGCGGARQLDADPALSVGVLTGAGRISARAWMKGLRTGADPLAARPGFRRPDPREVRKR